MVAAIRQSWNQLVESPMKIETKLDCPNLPEPRSLGLNPPRNPSLVELCAAEETSSPPLLRNLWMESPVTRDALFLLDKKNSYVLQAVYGSREIFNRTSEDAVRDALCELQTGILTSFDHLYDRLAQLRTETEKQLVVNAKPSFHLLRMVFEKAYDYLSTHYVTDDEDFSTDPRNIANAMDNAKTLAYMIIDQAETDEGIKARARKGFDKIMKYIAEHDLPHMGGLLKNPNIDELLTLFSYFAYSEFSTSLRDLCIIDSQENELQFGIPRDKALYSDLNFYPGYAQRVGFDFQNKGYIAEEEVPVAYTLGITKEIYSTQLRYLPMIREHLNKLFTELKPEQSQSEKLERIAHMYWWSAVACLSSRGSAAISNSLLEVLCRQHEIPTCQAKAGIALDLEAMLTPEDEFVTKFCRGEYGRILAA